MKLTQRIVLAGFILASLAGPAAREARAESIVPLTSERTGLVVYIGCGDAYFVRWARPHKGTIVHGLDTSARSVATVNEQIARLGVSGRMSAAVFDGKHLPYIDSVVNMLIAPKGHNVSRDEILRVLAPGGKAIVHQGDDPKMFTKPRPKTIGDWTHYLQGPGNNAVAQDTAVGPPRHMQWLAAPRWTRTHHGLNTVSAVVTAGGRIFSIIDSATPANKGVPGKWSIVARDAFNGVRLWTKKIDSWVIHPRFRSGPPQVTRLLVTGENRVYAPLGLGEPITVMDAATGKTLAVYSDTVGAEELILTGKTLLTLKSDGVPAHAAGHPKFKGKPAAPTTKTIVATNIATGKTLWQWTCEGGSPMPETLGSDGKRAFIQIGQGVACIDMTSGKVAWTYGPSKPTARGRSTAAKKAKPANGKPKPPRRRRPAPRMSFGKSTLVISDGVVLCNLSAGLTAISADKGEKLWVGDKGMGFHAPMDVFVINGVVWTGSHVRDSVAPPPVDDFSVGRDLKTGKVLKRNTIAVDLQTAGHHHRCYREKATVRYIITGKRGFEMMDMSGDEHSRNNWVRGTCQYGMMPANGLTYAPPHSCGCYMEAKLWGFWALAPASKAVADKQRIIPDAKRLTKGPAFGKINPQSAIRDPQSNWPQYRRDVRRSGVTATVVPAALKQLWKIDLGKKLTSPVVAGGKVIVAAVDAATVYALDEKTGKIAWRVTVGGRVDSAPAIHDGLVLFGCADGWV
ncbi:MAG: PQQ-binding-like beta-propeller repeat protein, partial [Phycisphaerae bacterium]|nr:PQQ-binding-like beta-propeller repeat protein [Phycisphaerae bacterium]